MDEATLRLCEQWQAECLHRLDWGVDRRSVDRQHPVPLLIKFSLLFFLPFFVFPSFSIPGHILLKNGERVFTATPHTYDASFKCNRNL